MKWFKSLLRAAHAFGRARQGVAATEFAMIAPLMFSLYFGVTELTDALIVDTRVTRAASTAADLVAQDTSVTNAEMTNIFNAIDKIMFPYLAPQTKVVVSSLVEGSNGTFKVAWSSAHNTTPRAVNSLVSVPAGLVATGGSVIYSEVTHPYTSPAGELIYGTINLTDSFYSRPRRVAKVGRTVN